MKLICNMIDQNTGEIKKKDFVNDIPIKNVTSFLRRHTRRETLIGSNGVVYESWKDPLFEVEFNIYQDKEKNVDFLKRNHRWYSQADDSTGDIVIKFDDALEAGEFIDLVRSQSV